MTVPDKYDLVLSKAIRAYPHDLEAIRSIHEHHRLSEKTLARRFETEIWKLATTNPRTFALNMVAVMRVLYGEARAIVRAAESESLAPLDDEERQQLRSLLRRIAFAD